jgi:hypothetical protein
MRLVASRNSLGVTGKLIVRFLGRYPRTWGPTLLRGSSDLGQIPGIIVIRDPHHGGLRPRTLYQILDRTNLANINVTNKTIGVLLPAGRSTSMERTVAISIGLPNRGIWFFKR